MTDDTRGRALDILARLVALKDEAESDRQMALGADALVEEARALLEPVGSTPYAYVFNDGLVLIDEIVPDGVRGTFIAFSIEGPSVVKENFFISGTYIRAVGRPLYRKQPTAPSATPA